MDTADRLWLEKTTVKDGSGTIRHLCSKSIRGTCTEGPACRFAHISRGRLTRPTQGFDARWLQSIAQVYDASLQVVPPSERPVRL
jgi:hypothetical protein